MFSAFQKNLTVRIALPAVTLSLLLIGALFFVFFPDMEANYANRKKEMLAQVTETAWSLIRTSWEQERQGLVSREAAQSKAAMQIRELRYGNARKEYFWITGMDHRMIMHPYRPDLEGMDMSQTGDVDENGEKLSVAFVKKIREAGHGVVKYSWQWKDEPGKRALKLSYVKGFKPWDWYIGTGIYLDDVKQEIAAIKRKIFGTIVGIFLFTSLLTYYIVRQGAVMEKIRKQTDRALTESKNRYEELADSLPQFVFETDIKGAFTFVNRHLIDTIGLQATDGNPDTNIFSVLVPEHRERAKANLKRILSGEYLGNAEYSIFTMGGERIPVMIHTNRILQDGSPVGLRGIAFDISAEKRAQAEREKLERQMQQAMKMETIGTLAGGIAHDFNNILSAILGYADLIKSKLPENDTNRRNIKQILNAGYRAKELVKQILTFSRQNEQEKHPLNLERLIKEAVNFLRASIPATIDIALQTSARHTVVMADATQIHQVILNLCTNAAHAMKKRRGSISVFLSEANPDELPGALQTGLPSAAYLKLRVKDNGHGIPPDKINRIFDPFFTTKKRDEGTGMGLSVVHGIVQNHGGFIEVKSKIGHGTTMDVYLPQCEDATRASAREDRPAPKGKERILLVDDEAMIVEIGEKMFEDLGYGIETTTRSIQALEWFRTAPDRFDIIITDLTMPRMTGLDLATQISRIRPGMPIILCTGHAEEIAPEAVRKAGIAKVVLKPLSANEMARTVRDALDDAAGQRHSTKK